MNIGEKIKKIRIAKNMKQSDLAEKVGISRVAIGNYERGDRIPKVEIAQKIANALDVSILDILEESDSEIALMNYLNDDLDQIKLICKTNPNCFDVYTCLSLISGAILNSLNYSTNSDYLRSYTLDVSSLLELLSILLSRNCYDGCTDEKYFNALNSLYDFINFQKDKLNSPNTINKIKEGE